MSLGTLAHAVCIHINKQLPHDTQFASEVFPLSSCLKQMPQTPFLQSSHVARYYVCFPDILNHVPDTAGCKADISTRGGSILPQRCVTFT